VPEPAFFISKKQNTVRAMSVKSYGEKEGSVPEPIVRLNRIVLLTGVIAALVFQQPLLITLLFVIIVPAVMFGKSASPIFMIGSRLLSRQIEGAAAESPQLMRFNNAIAAILLGASQLAFILGSPAAGWILAGITGAAAAVALGGFCFGCFLYYQFNLQRYRLFGK
jgi:hypothetical protein